MTNQLTFHLTKALHPLHALTPGLQQAQQQQQQQQAFDYTFPSTSSNQFTFPSTSSQEQQQQPLGKGLNHFFSSNPGPRQRAYSDTSRPPTMMSALEPVHGLAPSHPSLAGASYSPNIGNLAPPNLSSMGRGITSGRSSPFSSSASLQDTHRRMDRTLILDAGRLETCGLITATGANFPDRQRLPFCVFISITQVRVSGLKSEINHSRRKLISKGLLTPYLEDPSRSFTNPAKFLQSVERCIGRW